jgi:hypothetical protein
MIKPLNRFINLSFLHPLLFAIYPVLALWANNFSRIQGELVIRPLVTSLIAGIIIFVILRALLKNNIQAALLCTLIFLLYFSYGHIYSLIEDKSIFSFVIGRHRYLAGLWLLILGVGGWFIIKRADNASGLNRILNITGLILTVLTLSQILYSQISITRLAKANQLYAPENQSSIPASLQGKLENLPDIYYIILDGHTRDDVLRHDYQLDNSLFLQQLADLGFVIPNCTQSNYPETLLSMPATLNMNYLDAWGVPLDPDLKNDDYYEFISQYIRHSLVRKNLANLGYKMVSFQTTFPWVEVRDADVFIQNESSRFLSNILASSEFDDLLGQTTIFEGLTEIEKTTPYIHDKFTALQHFQNTYLANFLTSFYSSDRNKYDLIMYDLAHVEDVVNLPGKKFVYLHLPAPHAPIVLGPDGQFQTADYADKQGYANQVTYVDKRMIEIVKMILQESKTPPIIILQGDHGWGNDPMTRDRILNVYYLPGGGSKLIYPQITPINSFRIIFNYYFGGNYPLLPDKSVYTTRTRFRFTPVSPTCSDRIFSPQN